MRQGQARMTRCLRSSAAFSCKSRSVALGIGVPRSAVASGAIARLQSTPATRSEPVAPEEILGGDASVADGLIRRGADELLVDEHTRCPETQVPTWPCARMMSRTLLNIAGRLLMQAVSCCTIRCREWHPLARTASTLTWPDPVGNLRERCPRELV